MCLVQLMSENWVRIVAFDIDEVCTQAKWHIRPEFVPVPVAWSNQEYFYFPLDGMLVHRRVTPSTHCKPMVTKLRLCHHRPAMRAESLSKKTTQCPCPNVQLQHQNQTFPTDSLISYMEQSNFCMERSNFCITFSHPPPPPPPQLRRNNHTPNTIFPQITNKVIL